MKIYYKDQCLNLISDSKPDSCTGCCFTYNRYCKTSPILTLVCAVTDKIFKQEIKKDVFEL